MSKINIAVACHKSCRLPKNKLLVPVQTGSIYAKKRMNMAHDDEGDNISEKQGYCELRAQYWEWKNVEADYYGLCHYRRFLCFHIPDDAKRNERNQFEAEAIDDINLKRFGLENEDEMREVIESNDAIVGEYQNISKLFTPRGNQKTVYKHWTAHDRALIRTKDLDKMLELLSKVAPEIGSDAKEYLNKDVFTGFNCFVLKKDLFNELCEIEFKVLEMLEKEVDLSYYCTQLSRVCGFMGEIISSSYLYHIEKSGMYRVKHVPLVYFNYTDEENSIEPQKNSIPVVFCCDDGRPQLFGTIFQSFLNNLNRATKYDVILVARGLDNTLQEIFRTMTDNHKNVKVRFLDGDKIGKVCNEHYHPGKIEGLARQECLPILPFLPFVLREYKEALFFTTDILFVDSVDSLWNIKIKRGKIIAAALDSLMISRVNDIYPETEYNYLKNQITNPYEYYSIASMKIDLDKYRKTFSQYEIANKCWNNNNQLRNDEEIINVLCENMIQKIPQRWNTWFESDNYLKYQLSYMTLSNQQEQIEARKKPAVISYLTDDPWSLEISNVYQLFWKNARETPLYELYLGYQTEYLNQRKDHKIKITEKLFPKGSTLRGFVSRTIPKNSKGYLLIKKALGVFNME